MTAPIDPFAPLDFSQMEKLYPSLFHLTDLTEFTNSLPSVMNDAALDELLNMPRTTDPTLTLTLTLTLTSTSTSTRFDPNASSDRINIRIPIKVSRAYREAAAHRGVPYQTLINDTLRQATPGL